MFCCFETDKSVFPLRGLDDFMNHIGSVHHNFSGTLLGSTRCVVGRVAGIEERFDINIMGTGADVNQLPTHETFENAMAAATSNNDIEAAVKHLLNSDADVNQQLTRGEYGSALAAAASQKNNIRTVQSLLNAGADVNQQLTHGKYGSALAAAASQKNNIRTVQLLLNGGADVNQQLTHGMFALNISGLQTIELNWELPFVFEVSDDLEALLSNMATLTRKNNTVELAACGDFLKRMYGNLGTSLLHGIVKALESPHNFYADDDIMVKTTLDTVTVCAPESSNNVCNILQWICLTFRKPIPHTVSFSASKFKVDYLGQDIKLPLPDLLPLQGSNQDNECWRRLFDSAVVVLEPSLGKYQPSRGLELDFNVMLQLAAVEYPVMVDSGLVLIGYTTALIPINLTKDDMILWHIEVAKYDSQIKISDLCATRETWLRVENLEILQSKRALLGWCSESTILLRTDCLTPKVAWSGARVQQTTWHWRGANLQIVAQSAAPIQIGGQVGLSFDRSVNTLLFDPSQNYLRLLRSSMTEQIVLYDVSAGRAWLVPLLSVLHHMLLVYSSRIEEKSQASLAPLANPTSDGASASLEALRDNGGVIIEASGEDKLTIRELIMGFSVNFSRISLHPPRRSMIYGYEFMDIVMNPPKSELKKSQIEASGSAWMSLLSELNCLLCSDIGDVIIGKRSFSIKSPCNRLPQGSDLMAASMHSIERLSMKHGSSTSGTTHILTNTHHFLLNGDPFQQCQHDGNSNCCWSHPKFLQEIQARQSPEKSPAQSYVTCLNGALVFGGGRRTGRLNELLIRVREKHQSHVETVLV